MYSGSMGMPDSFASSGELSSGVPDSTTHDKDATVGSPNPVGPSYMDALGTGGPKAVVQMAKNKAIAGGARAVGKVLGF